MKAKHIVAAAIGYILAGSIPALAWNMQQATTFSRQATELEHQGKWKRINWQTDFNAARQRAIAEDKPILVFLVVQHRGNVNATDC